MYEVRLSSIVEDMTQGAHMQRQRVFLYRHSLAQFSGTLWYERLVMGALAFNK